MCRHFPVRTYYTMSVYEIYLACICEIRPVIVSRSGNDILGTCLIIASSDRLVQLTFSYWYRFHSSNTWQDPILYLLGHLGHLIFTTLNCSDGSTNGLKLSNLNNFQVPESTYLMALLRHIRISILPENH